MRESIDCPLPLSCVTVEVSPNCFAPQCSPVSLTQLVVTPRELKVCSTVV